MSKKLIFGSIIIAILAIIVLAITLTDTKQETVTVKMGNLPVVHGLPVYLAMDKNYFKEAGIDLELVQFQSPNQIIDALMQGQIDMGDPSIALGITGIAEYKNSGNLKIYMIDGGLNDAPGAALIIPTNSNIKSIEDLKGKKLGILAGTIQWQTITKQILTNHGLEYNKDVQIVELGSNIQVQAFAANQVDTLLALEPIPTILKQKGLAKNLVDHVVETEISNPSYYGAGVVRTQFAEENPELTEKIIAIINKAVKEIEANPELAKQYLKGHTALTDEIISDVPLPTFKMYNELTEKDFESVQKFYNIFTKFKVVDGNIEFKDFILKE